MDFWILLYLCPPDSSDSYSPATDTVKKDFTMSVTDKQLSAEMSDT